MSRSGYTDDFGYDDPREYNLYRASVDRSIKGKRGQAMLRELADALDAMPVKKLISRSFAGEAGVCTLGCLLKARGVDTSGLEDALGDEDDYQEDVSEEVAQVLDVARPLAAEVMFLNDDFPFYETDEQRWKRMRAWVDQHLQPPPTPKG